MPSPRVFFLGAGASKAAGIPLAGEIIPEILSTPPEQFPLKWVFENARWGQTVLQALAKNRSWVSDTQLDPLNIEEILNLLTLAADLRIELPALEQHVIGPTVALSQVTWLVLMLLELRSPDTLPPEYASFAARLKDEDTVVTVNYDLLVERALLGEFGSFNYRIEGFDVARIPSDLEISQGPAILKLHGSANWRFCEPRGAKECCGRMFVYAPDENLPAYGYGVVRLCECRSGDLRTPIIPPVALKRLTTAPFAELWRSAAQAMIHAGEVYIIGYSLPIYDVAIRELLRLVRAYNREARFVVVNPDPKARDRFRILGPTTEFIEASFSEFISLAE